MDKALKVQIPYPSLTGIEKDLESARIISPAYAGYHGELTAILQYIYHHYYFDRAGDEKTANLLIEIAVCEMNHLSILGELLLNLGVDPVFSKNPPFTAEFVSGECVSYSKTANKMLLDDISGEYLAIKTYGEILANLKNEQVEAVISRIKLDEELHVTALKDRYTELCAEN